MHATVRSWRTPGRLRACAAPPGWLPAGELGGSPLISGYITGRGALLWTRQVRHPKPPKGVELVWGSPDKKEPGSAPTLRVMTSKG